MKQRGMRLFLLLIFSMTAFATEVDYFTKRYIPLEDSAPKLNAYMNESIDEAVKEANGRSNCELQPRGSEVKLYSELNKIIGGIVWAKIEKKITDTNFVENHLVVKRNSVFRAFNWHNSFALALTKLGAIINLNGHIVGSDKIGHFIGIGLIYFKNTDMQGNSFDSSLRIGISTERGVFGRQSTGVYSYADLAANYDGYFFWSDLLHSKKSPSPNPFVTCVDGDFQRVRDFKWSDYVTDAWDEGINCNKFRTQSIREKFERQIEKLEEADPNNSYQCPLKSCRDLEQRYPEKHLNCL